ncbi:MAG TPA: HlyD family efflux transporter periplasmic adaptor subunit [Chloroflexota bacterium]|nr:HlyD family efflux transporter periplasmic adaptor subunit [Chloroflexota bacterium]
MSRSSVAAEPARANGKVLDAGQGAPFGGERPAPARPRRPRLRRAAGAALALGALLAFGLLRGWYVPASAGPVTALGTLEATEVAVSSEVSARIRDIPVVEGQVVQAGDVVVRLDDTLPQLQYRLGEAAEQQVLQVQLSKYVLTAPLSGVVQRRSAEPGEVALPGAPLLVLADITSLDVTVYLRQRDLGRVYVGQPVALEAEAFPGTVFLGVVRSVADQAEFTPRNTQTPQDRLNLVFAVKAHVANADRRLKAGMSVLTRFLE